MVAPLSGPYAPFKTLAELAAAAGVPMGKIDAYTTAQLRELARARAVPVTPPTRPGSDQRHPLAIRVNDAALHARALGLARAQNRSINAMLNDALRDYVDHQEAAKNG